ncbi:aspartate/glutamate racemase family protein [Piscinibacter sp.]|uniref:aspartate/glutamate racemase family protein n=1 Tax=Piscinibacter sp. TaxID=1903157 RepID=UPI0039E2D10A
MTRILLINPNTSAATTAMMVGIATAALPPGCVVIGQTAATGVPMMVDEAELDAAGDEVVRRWRADAPECDGVIVGAFGDPGMAGIRRLTRAPVAGIFESSVLEAAQGGRRFGVATVTPGLAGMIRRGIEAQGFGRLYTGIRLTAGAPRALAADPDALQAALGEAARQCIEDDGAEAVIIGGGPLGQAALELQRRLRAPIIAPIPAAARRLMRELRRLTNPSPPPQEAPMLWRFSANNTHLYPGALLRCLDAPGGARLSAGDTLRVEFSDGMVANGRLLRAQPDAAVLQMPSHRTGRNTSVASRTWRIAPGGEAGVVRVQKRLPAV